jgi:hypothetical protein
VNLTKEFRKKNRVEIRRKRQFNKGYDYAAGMLLRKEMSAEDLINIQCDVQTSNVSPFDDGINQAIRDWRNK